MNAVVYAWFSGHRQGEPSVEGQIAEAERFAAAHRLTVVKDYADRGQTRQDKAEIALNKYHLKKMASKSTM